MGIDLLNQAILLIQNQKYNEAVIYLENLINKEPDNPEFLNIYSIALFYIGEFNKAIKSMNKSLDLEYSEVKYKDLLGLYENIAIKYHKEGNTKKAKKYYKKYLKLDKNNSKVLKNLVNIYLYRETNYKKAIKYFEESLKYDDNPAIHYELSQIYLLLGKYKKGWKEYEYRTKVLGFNDSTRNLFSKNWNGEDLNNKTIVVYVEQGYGDSIQFIRFVKLLKIKYSCKVILYCQTILIRIFSTFKKLDKITSKLNEINSYDYSLSLLSLPYMLSYNKIKPSNKYLNVDMKDVKRFKDKYIDKNSFNIGIVWQGRKEHLNDENRSINLKYFKKLNKIKKVKLYSLQVENNERINNTDITNIGQYFNNFYDTAVAIKGLDLIISVDTSVAHLAGALGKECWILIPYKPDWRWGLNSTSSNLYTSVTIFRQKRYKYWEQSISKMKYTLLNKYIY